MLTSMAMMKLAVWLSNGGASAGIAISSAKDRSERMSAIITTISTSSAGATIMLKNLIEVGPLATMNQVSRIAPQAAMMTLPPVAGVEGSPPLISVCRPSIEWPNIRPSTASQPRVRKTTART